MNFSQSQIISKKRVSDHGEVFTGDREINAMLDLVKRETMRIESRFLEPACGTGNFLANILKRKLDIVEKRYSKNQIDYERYSMHALSSIYGIELLKDNVEMCQKRLNEIFTNYYLKNYKKKYKPAMLDSAKFVLSKNILWGNALDLRTPDENAEPIVFSQWSRPFNDSLFKRTDYKFEELSPRKNNGLFDNSVKTDIGTEGFIPQPYKNFPMMHYLKLSEL